MHWGRRKGGVLRILCDIPMNLKWKATSVLTVEHCKQFNYSSTPKKQTQFQLFTERW